MSPFAKQTSSSWRDVLAECLDPAGLVDCAGPRCRLRGSRGTELTITGWRPEFAAVRIRGEKGSAGVGHLPGVESRSGLLRSADYILFAQVENIPYAVVVELKKSLRPGDERAHEQVYRTRPMAAYLSRMARDSGVSGPQPELRHVVVAAQPGQLLRRPIARTAPLALVYEWRLGQVRGFHFLAEQLPIEALVADPSETSQGDPT